MQVRCCGKDRTLKEIDPRGLSEKQVKACEEIAARSDFDFFCCDMDRSGAEKYRGPVAFTYYTTDEKLHLRKVSVTGRVLFDQ